MSIGNLPSALHRAEDSAETRLNSHRSLLCPIDADPAGIGRVGAEGPRSDQRHRPRQQLVFNHLQLSEHLLGTFGVVDRIGLLKMIGPVSTPSST